MKTCQYVSTSLVAALLFLLGTDHVLAQLTRTDSQIAYYQQLIKRNPRNGRAFYGLGDALIRKARETGDPNYFNRAEEAPSAISHTSSTHVTSLNRRLYMRARQLRSKPTTAIPTVSWVTRFSKSASMMKLVTLTRK